MKLILQAIAIAAALAVLISAAKAQDSSVRIVALGASHTEGYGVATWESYPAQLEALLKENGIGAHIANAGISGDTTGGMLARLEKDVLPSTDIVILQPGTNDVRYGSGAQREENIARIKNALHRRGIKLIVIENERFRELPDSEMQDDGIHYTAKGYRLLAEHLLPEVLAAIRGK